MMLVKTYIAPSGIQGNGLFAGEAIKKGQRIWEFVEGFDVEFPRSFFDTLPPIGRDYLIRYTYPHPSKDGIMILDGDGGRFMNHDDAPNTTFTFHDYGIANVDIAEGEELVCDYREFAGEIDF